MATSVRAKPYSLAIRGVDDLDRSLPVLASDTDDMFEILFSDLSGVADDVAALGSGGGGGITSVVNDTNVTGSIAGAVLTLGWTGTLAQTRGGTGKDTSGATDGQLLIGKTSDHSFTLAALTAGSGIAITNGGGSISIAASGSSIFPSTCAQGDIFYGSAANTVSALAKSATATRYLANTGTSNNPAWAQVDVSNGVTGRLPLANLVQGAALSVLGVTGNATADYAGIAAGSDKQVLRRSGTALAFGAVDLSSSAAVTGNLPVGNLNGGTGATSSAAWFGDGTWKTLSSASVGADSLSVSRIGTPTGNYNLSTLGTIDFYANAGTVSSASYRNISTGSMHAKVSGEAMYLGIDWLARSRSPTSFTQNSSFMNVTTTAGDDMANSALSANVSGAGLFESTLANNTAISWGVRIVVPAYPQARKLFIEVESFSCSTQLTAILRGQGSITDTSQAVTGVSGSGNGHVYEIDYQAPTGGVLSVTFCATASVGASQSPNIKFYWAYITT